MSRPRMAFFDVDGTLTTATTLFRFLRHYLAATGHHAEEYRLRRHRLAELTAAGTPREDTNRAYFANYADADADTVAGLARDWYTAELRAGGFLHEPAVAALRRHRADGDLVVLVSGSFPACLAPLAEHLGADETHCTTPEIVDGRYTGDLLGTPMIGAAKATAVRASAATHRTPLERCTAYGDHDSDLPMLRTTGTATVVGGDPALRREARANAWTLLPTAAPPPPLPLPNPHTPGK